MVNLLAVGFAAATPSPVTAPVRAVAKSSPSGANLGPCGGSTAGVCIDTTKTACSNGAPQSGLCAGSASIKCCASPGVPVALHAPPPPPVAPVIVSGALGPCSGTPAGVCIDTSKTACPSQVLRSGSCQGAASIKCCVNAQAPTPAPVQSLGACSGTGFAGTCMDVTRTTCPSGDVRSNTCSGAASIKCCVARPRR